MQMSSTLSEPQLEPDIETLCNDASNAVRSLLSSTFQHMSAGDPKSKFCGVRNQLFIKILKMKTLRLCLDQAMKDFAELNYQESAIVRSYSAVDHPLPSLPAEIIVHIFSLAFRDDIFDVYRVQHSEPEKMTLYKTLTSSCPQRHLRQLFLSSVTFDVYTFSTTHPEEGVLRQLQWSDPMKLAVYQPGYADFYGGDSNLNLLLQFPNRWKELHIYDMPDVAFLKKCTPALPHIEIFQFMDSIRHRVNKEDLRADLERFPDDLLGGHPARLHSAKVTLHYLKKFVTSGFFHTVTNLYLQLKWVDGTPPIHPRLSILSELPKLSSLTLAEDVYREDVTYTEFNCGRPLQLPSLTALHLQDFSHSGIEVILGLFGSCRLQHISLTKYIYKPPKYTSRAISLLHDTFPGLAGLECDSNLTFDDLVKALCEPNEDGVWILPALRSLVLLDQVDTARLKLMLRARLSSPEVVPINYIKVRIPIPFEKELGTDLIALHELEKLVPNVVRLS